ncbi:MAG: MBL fold metallo-hydrolase [Gemmatimonadetes bacterium]|nr:MBL fold metallo-hydrolase [Gemmatimonadota bacterium]MDE2679066.1 MBL fold metallo-hydrolase [Gemmatimonadota bacterium]MYD12424.1 MBL fold metallo-hydrolase [Gemmatimonadota bacterium]MYJ67087.1 MBL fold metallo-hydrolase [Gemmatimonadota bacterium]
MTLTFLGTGTSFGVPVIGCSCANCTSADPRDRRTRHGALLELEGGNLLVDTPPELRLQLLACGIDRVDAVWYTHLHADHVHGIDDVRIFSTRGRGAVPTYVTEEMKDELTGRFPYIFDERVKVARGTTKPRLALQTYTEGVPLRILGVEVIPFRVPHGPEDAFGFRAGALGYVTDAKRLPGPAREILRGVDVLVLNALWLGSPHPTHFNVEEAVEAALEVGAGRTYLTHLTHKVGYGELMEWLPDGIRPAFDGLVVEVN